MIAWFEQHTALLAALAGVSVLLFVGSVLVTPLIVARIPPDYFTHDKRPPSRWSSRHPAIRVTLLLSKNTLGVVLMLVGSAMLFTPGQGLLTLLVGFMLLDFPGKYRFERWLIGRRRVLGAVNWIRRRRGKPPLLTA